MGITDSRPFNHSSESSRSKPRGQSWRVQPSVHGRFNKPDQNGEPIFDSIDTSVKANPVQNQVDLARDEIPLNAPDDGDQNYLAFDPEWLKKQEEKLSEEDWFRVNSSREDAASELFRSLEGTYVVRVSNKLGHYAISIQMGKSIESMLVVPSWDRRRATNGHTLYRLGTSSTLLFKSVKDLVDYYHRYPFFVDKGGHYHYLKQAGKGKLKKGELPRQDKSYFRLNNLSEFNNTNSQQVVNLSKKFIDFPSGLRLSVEEKGIYDSLFYLAKPSENGSIGASNGMKFFRASKLDDATLGRIWILADKHHKGSLEPENFYTAVKLCALAQSGYPVSLTHLQVDTCLPNFGRYTQLAIDQQCLEDDSCA